VKPIWAGIITAIVLGAGLLLDVFWTFDRSHRTVAICFCVVLALFAGVLARALAARMKRS
jgi:hypothetical protein